MHSYYDDSYCPIVTTITDHQGTISAAATESQTFISATTTTMGFPFHQSSPVARSLVIISFLFDFKCVQSHHIVCMWLGDNDASSTDWWRMYDCFNLVLELQSLHCCWQERWLTHNEPVDSIIILAHHHDMQSAWSNKLPYEYSKSHTFFPLCMCTRLVTRCSKSSHPCESYWQYVYDTAS